MNLKCITTIKFFSLLFCISHGFQVPSDLSNTYKKVIETTTKQRVVDCGLPFVPFDDKTYSPDLPPTRKNCPLSRPTTSTLPAPFPNDEMIDPLKISDKVHFENAIKRKSLAALPLYKSGVTDRLIAPNRNAVARRRFGFDDMPSEYWFDNRIHSFGNTGFFGGLHAAAAPLATKLIDNAAYDGEDVRTRVSKSLRKNVINPNPRILDLCCGVGTSSRALSDAFPDAEIICGVDTSPQMIAMARFITTYEEIKSIIKKFNISGISSSCTSSNDVIPEGSIRSINFNKNNYVENISALIKKIQMSLLLPMKKVSSKTTSIVQPNRKLYYALGNAERVKVPENTFDLISCMYSFHEIPRTARYRILREARRLLRDGGTLCIVDISIDYIPSPAMLAGEPYVMEYKEHISQQMKSLQGFCELKEEVVVPGHVHKWVLTRRRNKSGNDGSPSGSFSSSYISFA